MCKCELVCCLLKIVDVDVGCGSMKTAVVNKEVFISKEPRKPPLAGTS